MGGKLTGPRLRSQGMTSSTPIQPDSGSQRGGWVVIASRCAAGVVDRQQGHRLDRSTGAAGAMSGQQVKLAAGVRGADLGREEHSLGFLRPDQNRRKEGVRAIVTGHRLWSDGGHRGAMSNRPGAVFRRRTLEWVVRNIPLLINGLV